MKDPLAWYIAGPLIGLMVPILLLLRGKQFGISSSYRYLLSILPSKVSYFNYDRKIDGHQVVFAAGLILSGVLAANLSFPIVYEPIIPSKGWQETAVDIYSISNGLQFLLGGILVGFGSRYANGCTAGHCIMGVSQFSVASITSTIAFFVGGLIGTFFINPFIF